MIEYKMQIAECIIRIFTGILFFFPGYDKIFKIKLKAVAANFLEEAEHIHIHKPLVFIICYITSYTELIGGALLITGLFINYSLPALGIDLVLVCLAFSIIRPMWDMQYVFPRLLLIIILLFLPNDYHRIGLDYFLRKA
jgi:uncharacterized membrane protein YphA (DoxX/SURF4 family)